jgi:hypothetical protein
MGNNHSDKKTLAVAIFIAAAAIITYVGYNEVMAQSTGNQTAAGTGNQTAAGTGNQTAAGTGNQSQAETLKSLGNLTGSDQNIMSKDKSISNSNNSLGNSLATNEFQSY